MTPLISFLIGFALGWLLGCVFDFHIARKRVRRASDLATHGGSGHVPPRPLPPRHAA